MENRFSLIKDIHATRTGDDLQRGTEDRGQGNIAGEEVDQHPEGKIGVKGGEDDHPGEIFKLRKVRKLA